jgi:hypothetical protein
MVAVRVVSITVTEAQRQVVERLHHVVALVPEAQRPVAEGAGPDSPRRGSSRTRSKLS